MTTSISVVVPTYNRGRLIQSTLDSILAQTRPADEVIVIDDGSTDDTEFQLSRFRNRIRYHRISNSGIQTARNTGISLTSGKWIALCDSDDLWLPDYLDRQTKFVSAHPELNFSFSNFRTLKDGNLSNIAKFDEAPVGYWKSYIKSESSGGWILKNEFVGGSFIFFPIFPSASIFTKSLFDLVGGFDPALRGRRGEDGFFITLCLLHGRVGAIPEPLVVIRKHGGNDSGDQLMLLMDEVKSLAELRDRVREARPYREVIEAEITRRSIDAAQLAFCRQDHALMRRILSNIPSRARPLKLRLKQVVALLPDVIGQPVNAFLQRIAERKHNE